MRPESGVTYTADELGGEKSRIWHIAKQKTLSGELTFNKLLPFGQWQLICVKTVYKIGDKCSFFRPQKSPFSTASDHYRCRGADPGARHLPNEKAQPALFLSLLAFPREKELSVLFAGKNNSCCGAFPAVIYFRQPLLHEQQRLQLGIFAFRFNPGEWLIRLGSGTPGPGRSPDADVESTPRPHLARSHNRARFPRPASSKWPPSPECVFARSMPSTRNFPNRVREFRAINLKLKITN